MTKLTNLSRSIEGKVALITGSGSGMGRATAFVFAEAGAKVVVSDVNEKQIDEVANEITSQLLQADFTADTKLVCKYDLGEVRALDADKSEVFKRMNTGVQGGWITVGEARKAVGRNDN